MTNNEILQADLLDILFEHRNKAYGAYALRRNYPYRLKWALGTSLSMLLLLMLAFEGRKGVESGPPQGTVLTLQTFADPEKPKPPDPPRPKAEPSKRQRIYTDRVKIVDNTQRTTMPEQNDLKNAQISVHNVDGLATDDPGSGKPPLNEAKQIKTSDGSVEQEKIFSSSDAEFPGGVEAFRKFLTRYLVTPEELQVGEKKTVLIRFKVDVDGAISDPQITQTGGVAYDKEVLRVLSMMPKWIPATQNGRKVATWFTQPVTFIGVE